MPTSIDCSHRSSRLPATITTIKGPSKSPSSLCLPGMYTDIIQTCLTNRTMRRSIATLHIDHKKYCGWVVDFDSWSCRRSRSQDEPFVLVMTSDIEASYRPHTICSSIFILILLNNLVRTGNIEKYCNTICYTNRK